jgi:hypothetical protein
LPEAKAARPIPTLLLLSPLAPPIVPELNSPPVRIATLALKLPLALVLTPSATFEASTPPVPLPLASALNPTAVLNVPPAAVLLALARSPNAVLEPPPPPMALALDPTAVLI